MGFWIARAISCARTTALYLVTVWLFPKIGIMANETRYVIWAHREAESPFGPASDPVIRNGALLFFNDRLLARCECDSLNSFR